MMVFRAHTALRLSAIAVVCLCVTACGSANRRTRDAGTVTESIFPGSVTTVASPARPGSYVKDDNDPIKDDPSVINNDDSRMREYGHPASAVDKQTITALVKGYYSLAAAGKGAATCSLIYSALVKKPTMTKVIPPDYFTPPPVPRVLSGESCAQAASLIFAHEHQLLTAKVATLQVTGVRVKGEHGVAMLGFRTTPERWMPVAHEGRVWKIDALLDHELP